MLSQEEVEPFLSEHPKKSRNSDRCTSLITLVAFLGQAKLGTASVDYCNISCMLCSWFSAPDVLNMFGPPEIEWRTTSL